MMNKFQSVPQNETVSQQSITRLNVHSSDLRLATEALEGCDSARTQVVEKVCDRVWRTLSFLSHNPQEVDDLTQNALIKILESLSNYRAESSLENWAEKIAIRTATKLFEKNRRRRALFASYQDGVTLAHFNTFNELDEDFDVASRFKQCLIQLPAHQRTAILAHHMNGYGVHEIADICGCSPFTIAGRLRRGRRLLKKIVLADPDLNDWIHRELNWRDPK